MDESVEHLLTEIDDILFELKEISEALSKLDPVSHKGKGPVVWVGGIPGAIREIREGNKLMKLINAPIYNDKSFYNLAFIIADYAEKLSEKQVKIQNLVEKDNCHYFEKVEPIVRIVNEAVAVWYNYSPEMAEEPITIGSEKNVSLSPSIRAWIKDDLVKIDYPDEMSGVKESLKSDTGNKGGCLGAIMVLLMLSASITAIAATII